ncbi:MAG: response regulator [Bacteroidales bacterium]|nr:response regulator [Bacteroidales bacterium]
MLQPTNIVVMNFPLTLLVLGGLFFLIVLFVYLLFNRRKNKYLLIQNKQLENEIKQLKEELKVNLDSIDIKIHEKTKALQEQIEDRKSIDLERKIALKKAEESNFLKNTFLSSMSREIRTPLSGIIGFSNILLHEIDSKEKPEMYDMANSIVESSSQLLELMGHIMDLSRIEAKNYELKIDTFEVNAVLDTCVKKITDSATKKELEIDFKQGDNYLAEGDKEAFEKSVDLILDNAIKYTLQGKITIRLETDTHKNKLKVLVSDTGIGIDKSFLSDIFEAFRQDGTGYSRIQQGAGLGLPLAHKLVHLMDGELLIESKKNRGTTVSFLLSLTKKKHISGEEILPTGAPKDNFGITTENQASIFIVEDDKMNRLIFENMLNKYASVQIAVDGEDAFKKLNEAFQSNLVYDIILLDINLPSPWDGMLLLKEFKKRWPKMNKIPFVAQTAYALTGDKEKFLAAGFDDYISKPIDKTELFTIIENNMHKFGTLKNLIHEK